MPRTWIKMFLPWILLYFHKMIPSSVFDQQISVGFHVNKGQEDKICESNNGFESILVELSFHLLLYFYNCLCSTLWGCQISSKLESCSHAMIYFFYLKVELGLIFLISLVLFGGGFFRHMTSMLFFFFFDKDEHAVSYC